MAVVAGNVGKAAAPDLGKRGDAFAYLLECYEKRSGEFNRLLERHEGRHIALPIEYADMLAKLHTCLGSLEGKRLLELGCAAGTFLPALKERGAEVKGIDSYLPLVEEGAKFADVRQGNVKYLREFFPKGYFDAVFGRSFFEKAVLREETAAFAALASFEILKPGGFFIQETGIAFSLRKEKMERVGFETLEFLKKSSTAYYMSVFRKP